MDTVHNPSQDVPSEGQNDRGFNNQTTTHDVNKPKIHKTLDEQRTITLSSALDREEDMRVELQYLAKMADLTNLSIQKEQIRKLVASHCGLASPDMFKCRSGSRLPAKMALSVPLLHKIDEKKFPGNAEEKVRSEAATYIWIHENFPDTNLHGFGVPGGLSSLSKFRRELRDFLQYIPQNRTTFFEYSYILIDWIEGDDSQMLAYTWNGLYRLKRLRIYTGAFQNFYLDLFVCHDSRLQYQKNSAGNERDAREQARDLVMMRALLHKFTRQHFRNGTFVIQLTDLYLGNIFVDKDWNLKYVIDLEWTCSLPLQNLLPPHWLTGKGIDLLKGPEYGPFKTCYEKFAKIFEEEEHMVGQLRHNGHHLSRATSLESALEDGRFWYLTALRSPRGLSVQRFQTASNTILWSH
ncbi:hypothetical protein ACJ73_01707 [Blastomyces percursus]|uniref:Aminoglycoside phosphotransferase domain-containing protein n=1 Tax=Blastomyces percursus TaxID=1658174 RepID=A0A1J9QEJ6_9EURO|nr:hypothetical protein ACJ73_01707 [Blastomyces percursus]